MSGFLDKIKIIGFKEATESSLGVPFSIYIGMFNPEKYSTTKQSLFNNDRRHGATGSEQRFNREQPRTFNFDFLVDGTGASGEKREVLADVILFRATCGFIGDTHRPTYLIIQWGTFLARCVLTSLTIDYTLFRPDGTPLRATLKASFTEYTTPALEQLQNFLSSPDVTHVRTITATDRLDLMSYNIYKDSKYYMELARVNNLNNFRKLKVGDKIVFPPIEKNK
jgi:nucleoid-associated protein YgaU